MEKHWTEEERAALLEYAKQGLTADQVAKRLKRSRNSVLGFAYRQFKGFRMVKPNDPPKLKPLHVPKKVQKPRADGLSPSGKSLKSLPKEVVDAIMPKMEMPPGHKPVRMLKTGRFQCRYIVTDIPRDHDPMMCGAPVIGTRSWCQFHYDLVFSKMPPKKV